MVTRPNRIAPAAYVVIAACAALARCGGNLSPTEPGRSPNPTPSRVPSPTSTPPSPTPPPTPSNGALFGYVSTVSGVTEQYLSGVVLRLHQDGTADQITSSASGSLDGYYAFCCLRPGPAVISARLAGYAPFNANIIISQTPTQYNIRIIPERGAPNPTQIPVPVEPSDAR